MPSRLLVLPRLLTATLLLVMQLGSLRAEVADAYRLDPAPTQAPAKLEGLATAFVVAPSLLVTNEHVVRGHTTLVLRNVDNNARVEARVVARDAASDLALLQATVPAKPLPVASVPAALRAPVAVVGFPDPRAFGEGKKLALGWVRETSSAKNPELLTLDVSVRGGNSGSPILASNGQVVGVVTGGFTEPVLMNTTWTTSDPIAGGAKLESLVAFLRKNKVPYLSHSYQGTLQDIATELAAGVYLVEVPEN